MRLIFVLSLFVLSACNAPTPFFRDVPAQRVTIDGSVFDIRLRGELAEAVRINPQYAPRLGPIEGRAARAMVAVSGCPVRLVSGDQALLLGQLDCDGQGPLYVPGPPVTLDCERVSGPLHIDDYDGFLDFDCAIY